MKRIFIIFLLSYYSFGIFCLPRGDFSLIVELPEMYRHCKATEDKDMTPFDFITDHLVNIDGIFDKHDNGDDQKPHTTNPAQHHGQTQFSVIAFYTFSITQFHLFVSQIIVPPVNIFPADHCAEIFHPPIV